MLISQNDEIVRTVNKSNGMVTIDAGTSGASYDGVTLSWQVPSELTDTEVINNQLIFDPSNTPEGNYAITINAIENDTVEQLSEMRLIWVRVINDVPILSDEDTDGDGKADIDEGITDSDFDGIVDYLDNYQLPAGMYYILGGEEESRQENFAGLSQILLITAIGIFAILVLQSLIFDFFLSI